MKQQQWLRFKLHLLNVLSEASEQAMTEQDRQLFEELFDVLWGELARSTGWYEKANRYVFRRGLSPHPFKHRSGISGGKQSHEDAR